MLRSPVATGAASASINTQRCAQCPAGEWRGDLEWPLPAPHLPRCVTCHVTLKSQRWFDVCVQCVPVKRKGKR
eukprot:3365088-Prymnesium_polylepis.1